MFCPFVKGDCVSDCVFNNHKFNVDSQENCTIMMAAMNIQAAEFFERTPEDYLKSIESKLNHIDNNTSRDQTDSWHIDEKMDYVLGKLNDIKERI